MYEQQSIFCLADFIRLSAFLNYFLYKGIVNEVFRKYFEWTNVVFISYVEWISSIKGGVVDCWTFIVFSILFISGGWRSFFLDGFWKFSNLIFVACYLVLCFASRWWDFLSLLEILFICTFLFTCADFDIPMQNYHKLKTYFEKINFGHALMFLEVQSNFFSEIKVNKNF